MSGIILKEECYEIVGACMEVHSILGFGFREAVYKDALEYEFHLRDIPFEREKSYKIEYKGRMLPRRYPADFIVYNSIILEVKARSLIINDFVLQTRNYLKAAGLRLGS